ncbi:MAG: Bax inhibitor-1 family protein [Solirubrobacteraceae bacterium]
MRHGTCCRTAAGYATRRDLSLWGRTLFWALLLVMAFGLVALFVSNPHVNLIWSIAGPAIFGGFTIFDFNRLRRSGNESAVPIRRQHLFDIVNVFLLVLQLFSGERNWSRRLE